MSQEKILQAIAKLDHSNDNQWTTSGLPRVEVIEELSGINTNRTDITNALPDFIRKNEPPATGSTQTTQSGADEHSSGEDEDEDDSAPLDKKADLTAQMEEAGADVVDARKTLAEAKKAYHEKQAVLDALVIEKSKLESSVTQADSIKAFQKSQQAQRVASGQHQKKMKKLLANIENEAE